MMTENDAIKLFLDGESVRIVEIRQQTARAVNQKDGTRQRRAALIESACVAGSDAFLVTEWAPKTVDGDQFVASFKTEFVRGDRALFHGRVEKTQYGPKATGTLQKLASSAATNPGTRQAGVNPQK